MRPYGQREDLGLLAAKAVMVELDLPAPCDQRQYVKARAGPL